MKRATGMTCLLMLWPLALATVTPAEARRGEHAPHSETARHDGVSLDEAAARVRRDTGGRILSAQAREDRGRTSYRIKVLLPDGAVRVVDMDAQSGETR